MKKILIFLGTLLIFSQIFAAPAPAPKGGPGNNGGKAPSPSGPSNPGSRPSGPTPGNSRPSPPPTNVPPKPGMPVPSGSKPSNSSPEVLNYRGTRTTTTEKPLKVLNCLIVETKKDNLQLEIKFNQSLNPLSITKDSFLINEKKADINEKIIFNQKGDLLIITFKNDSISQEELKMASIKIENIKTFDGKNIKELEIQ